MGLFRSKQRFWIFCRLASLQTQTDSKVFEQPTRISFVAEDEEWKTPTGWNVNSRPSPVFLEQLPGFIHGIWVKSYSWGCFCSYCLEAAACDFTGMLVKSFSNHKYHKNKVKQFCYLYVIQNLLSFGSFYNMNLTFAVIIFVFVTCSFHPCPVFQCFGPIWVHVARLPFLSTWLAEGRVSSGGIGWRRNG